MPVLDTVTLFGAADPKDPAHEKSLAYLGQLGDPRFYLATFALIEFDIVMKSRGLSHNERMIKHALLSRDYPLTVTKTRPISPHILYLAATIEGEVGLDYFDAAVAAEAKALDGEVVSTDKIFDRVQGIKRVW